MIATFKPCRLAGTVDAPPSKSMAHRYLIGAALSGKVCTLSGIDYSEDILATIDCLKALGASVTIAADQVIVDPRKFLQTECPVLECRESGSTLRFLLYAWESLSRSGAVRDFWNGLWMSTKISAGSKDSCSKEAAVPLPSAET